MKTFVCMRFVFVKNMLGRNCCFPQCFSTEDEEHLAAGVKFFQIPTLKREDYVRWKKELVQIVQKYRLLEPKGSSGTLLFPNAQHSRRAWIYPLNFKGVYICHIPASWSGHIHSAQWLFLPCCKIGKTL